MKQVSSTQYSSTIGAITFNQWNSGAVCLISLLSQFPKGWAFSLDHFPTGNPDGVWTGGDIREHELAWWHQWFSSVSIPRTHFLCHVLLSQPLWAPMKSNSTANPWSCSRWPSVERKMGTRMARFWLVFHPACGIFVGCEMEAMPPWDLSMPIWYAT